VTLTDDSRQAVWKELRSKNKQMDGSPMGAIVLLQQPFCKPGKTMKYCTLVSTLMARLLQIYISLQISDLKSISNSIVKIAPRLLPQLFRE
jgi:hypothetical protein